MHFLKELFVSAPSSIEVREKGSVNGEKEIL